MFTFDVIPFTLAKDWLNNLYSALRNIDSERKAELEQIAAVFGDPEELAKFYVEPDCQQFNPADSYEEDSYVVREPIFERAAAFLQGESNRTCKHLFVLSDAGMGKTSFLVMLKLGHLTSFWPKNFDCKLLKLGSDTLSEIEKIKSPRDTVLLLDALDEDPLIWADKDHRIWQILSITRHFRRIVITCRTQIIDQRSDPFHRPGCIEIGNVVCPTIYNSLFSDTQVIRYLTRRFPANIGNQAWEERVTNIIRSMGTLKMRPMLLAHIDDLLESSETNWNEFTIYKALIMVWLLREHSKILEVEGTAPPVQELYSACRYMALQILSKDRPYLTAEEMAARGKAFAAFSSISLMQLGVRSLLNRDTQGNYRFCHFSIVEFLLVDTIIEGAMQSFTKGLRQTSLMSVFAAAWIKNGNSKSPLLNRLRPIELKGADFSGCDLSRVNLSGFDCSSANFSGATLVGADFSYAKLNSAILRNANISGANFQLADLGEADLSSADATNAHFRSCNLNETSFEATILRGANLDTQKCADAKFTDIEVDEKTTYSPSIRMLLQKPKAH